MIEDAFIDSSSTRNLPLASRRLVISGRDYPIRLRHVADLHNFRQELTATAARTARDTDSIGGGNPTKRIRLELGSLDELTMHKLAEILAEGAVTVRDDFSAFQFRPQAPGQSSASLLRKAIEPTVVTRLHTRMQGELYGALVQKYGKENVGAECVTCSGLPADLIVKTGDGYEIFEIKTSRSPRDCVRQAVGQLLEYAYWPGSPHCSKLWAVGPSPIDSSTTEYLGELKKQFSLPIDYRQQESDG